MEKQPVHSTAEEVRGSSRRYRHLSLVTYDCILLLLTEVLLLGVNPSSELAMHVLSIFWHFVLAAGCIYLCRRIANVYRQIWRYSFSGAYIRLILSDFVAVILYYTLQLVLPMEKITFLRVFSVVSLNLLLTIGIRLIYQYGYEYANSRADQNSPFIRLFQMLTGLSFDAKENGLQNSAPAAAKIRIAIVGAGSVGVMLAEELLKNPRSSYAPCCFIDIDRSKIGREILGLPVLPSNASISEKLARYAVQEIVFALPRIETDRLKELYAFYKETGCKVKVYDYPVMQTAESGKRHLREFDIEELLFRQPVDLLDEKTSAYYRDKVVLITGGGGSIGSELCRQIARMQPKTLVIADIYENGAYDIQQELRIAYGEKLRLCVEIVSVCDVQGLEKVFRTHRPQIVLHAAAHKHVPLMEHNCCEAVQNNIFGTWNAVCIAEKYRVERFIMISTDKAVNPTNVMGATKRICEMIVQSRSQTPSETTFSATRFGNVLGSAGSVVPLFKKQILNGGPVTVTDKRIIRYFMTIPEASQLVLQSGVMAKNGELFVLDMGKSVRILELAESMIRLSGFEPYRDIDIVETGLRPGEKLYEELLIRTEELDQTENSMIFIERDAPLSPEEL